MKSRDLTAAEAVKELKKLEKVGDIRSFVKGDTRSTVNTEAEKRVDSIKSKPKAKKAAVEAKPAKDEKPAEKKTTPSR